MSDNQAPKLEISLSDCTAEESSDFVLVVIPDVAMSAEQTQDLTQALSGEFRLHILTSKLPAVDQVFAFAEVLAAELAERGVKRGSFFGIGSGGSVAQALAVSFPRVVRRLILLDSSTRLAQGFLMRVIDRIERFLPLGLPLRRLAKDFDSRPFLHRIRCPVLVLNGSSATPYIKEQGQFLAEKIPNAWATAVQSQKGTELRDLLKNFLQVPVKRPQG